MCQYIFDSRIIFYTYINISILFEIYTFYIIKNCYQPRYFYSELFTVTDLIIS